METLLHNEQSKHFQRKPTPQGEMKTFCNHD